DARKLEGITSFPTDESPSMIPGKKQGKDTSDWQALDQRYYALWAMHKTMVERLREEGLRTDDLMTDEERL
ncbi:MAG: hypothetical protein GWN58_36325, partial [Anaerolineae bacterium]|nr:hypothetical protein [Anaerolineae bacterium]